MLLQYSKLLDDTAALDSLQAIDKKEIYPVCHMTYNRDTWVTLNKSGAPRDGGSMDVAQAQLLRQNTADTWVALIPNQGEVILNRGDFYC